MDNIPFFRLKKPCSNCPFRKDTSKGWLGKRRAKQISEDIKDLSFSCHKTTYNDKVKEAFCVGAIILSGKESYMGNKSIRIGAILGVFDPDSIKGHDKIFDSYIEFINHHKRDNK
jgi:hypothetical protein